MGPNSLPTNGPCTQVFSFYVFPGGCNNDGRSAITLLIRRLEARCRSCRVSFSKQKISFSSDSTLLLFPPGSTRLTVSRL
ncbi:Succinate-semialdehyde dehydrogenase [Fusarium oxysporum f. sp. albedinis]|nr:Succinate-semialdehyde dehydrogenase [Fusarium oxysporum f. sp. albedinis]